MAKQFILLVIKKTKAFQKSPDRINKYRGIFMTNLEIFFAAMSLIVTPFLGLISFFLKRIIKKLDDSSDKAGILESEVKTINVHLSNMKVDIERALTLASQITHLTSEVEVLKRDLNTCFIKLDKLTEKVENDANRFFRSNNAG